MAIYWTKPTESGLGDRLTDVLYVATYAKILQSDLIVTWEAYRGHEKVETRLLDPAFRYVDTMLNNVLEHIIFPPHVRILPFCEIKGTILTRWVHKETELAKVRSVYDTFEHSVGGNMAVDHFWQTHLKDKISYEEYLRYFDETARQFGFCDPIKAFLATLPERFVSFHIRRGDKVRNELTDGTYINPDQLDDLNRLTHKWLRYFAEDKKYENFFLCGDEDEKKQEFIDYLVGVGKRIITLPKGLEKWQQTYYDMAVMTKSDYNMASNRFSAFSRFPSFIGGKRWRTVYLAENEGP